ncbi:uncharacterized protein LOC134687637 [Mytilus trossulus]|uniref:uncharacterized protein LOC134687637 n=1 Tax=Mytilus trossulus TaxID=6551 RepID=UPI003003B643
MMELLRSIVFVVLVSISYADVCEDVDTKSCEILAALRTDLCSNPCLSKLCNRHCGHCPVKCYQCHEIDDPSNCTNLIACPSADHYCYTTQTFTDDFTEVYKMGCAIKSVCQQYLGGAESMTRNIDVNGACCMQDKCNNKLPLVIMGAEVPTTQQPVTFVNTTADPSSCKNLDDGVCQRLAMASPGICSDKCFAENVCPRMCGSCLNCYTCNDIDNITDCTTINVCQSGHECFTLETLSIDLRPVFRVGCIEEKLCSRFQASTGNIFGRRDGFSLKGGCCKSDLCNDHVGTINNQPTTTTTQQPTTLGCTNLHQHCPAGFHSLDSSCYMIGPQRMSWQDAKSYCESHCARLVDFSSRSNMQDIFALLVPHRQGNYQDERVWTDATYSRSNWVWSHNGNYISSRSFRNLVHSHSTTHACGFAMVHTSSGGIIFSPTTTEDLIADRCSATYLPLCEASRN